MYLSMLQIMYMIVHPADRSVIFINQRNFCSTFHVIII